MRQAGAILIALAATACATQAPYQRPAAPETPPAFHETADWKTAAPADQTIRGTWWELFDDPQLNALEAQIDVSNETLKAQQARFAQARAAIAISRSDRYPQVTASPSVLRARTSAKRSQGTQHVSDTDFLLPIDASYELDVWGRVRSTIDSSRAAAQASAADLESVRLSLHAELALDYFELRGLDAEQQILDAAVTAYTRALELTRARFTGGIASQADVAQAETQLETTRVQRTDLLVQRSALEHAIAVLVGKAPASLQLGPLPLTTAPPDLPIGLPADVLERRPDIASAERRVASANADLGVAKAAFFPRLLLTATAGFESTSLAAWISGLGSFWTAGPVAVATVFDGGRRRAVSEQARAAYEATVSDYRGTILTAFQEVEDNLAALRVLHEEADIQAAAVAAADRSLTLANNRYRGGVASYLEVITAQNAALANQRSAVDILSRRMSATILLIKALGGGWNVSSLPALKEDGRIDHASAVASLRARARHISFQRSTPSSTSE